MLLWTYRHYVWVMSKKNKILNVSFNSLNRWDFFRNKKPWNVSSSGRNGYAPDINLVQLLWRSTLLAMLLLCPWRPMLFRSCGQVCPPAGQITQWLEISELWQNMKQTLPHVASCNCALHTLPHITMTITIHVGKDYELCICIASKPPSWKGGLEFVWFIMVSSYHMISWKLIAFQAVYYC